MFFVTALRFTFNAKCQYFLSSNSAIAAEQVVLKYRSFRESISVEELSNFAETGDLNLAATQFSFGDKTLGRFVLTQPVQVNVILLDRVLNSRIGNLYSMKSVKQFIHPLGRLTGKPCALPWYFLPVEIVTLR